MLSMHQTTAARRFLLLTQSRLVPSPRPIGRDPLKPANRPHKCVFKNLHSYVNVPDRPRARVSSPLPLLRRSGPRLLSGMANRPRAPR